MSNFQEFRFPLNFQEMLVSDSITAADITFGPVPPGHLWVITNVAVLNEDNNADRAQIILAGFGEDHYLASLIDISDQVIASVNQTYYIPEGRTLTVRVVGSVLLDVLHACIQGFDVIQPEGAKAA